MTLFNNIGLNENQHSIILYVLKVMIKNSFMWLTVLFITSITNTWLPTLIFMLTFMAIRYSFGGWHSKSEYVCFAVSSSVSILAGYIAKMVDVSMIVFVTIYLFALTVALVVGVVDNPVKRLSVEKKKRFKKRGLIILFILFIINIMLFNLRNTEYSNAVLFGILISFFNLLFGR